MLFGRDYQTAKPDKSQPSHLEIIFYLENKSKRAGDKLMKDDFLCINFIRALHF